MRRALSAIAPALNAGPMTQLLRPTPAANRFQHVHSASARLVRSLFLVGFAALLMPASLAAQTQQPALRPAAHKPSAATKAQQRAQIADSSAPAAAHQPKWPAREPAAPPTVTFNSQGLHIVAENSDLSSILNQISTETGAKVEGLSGDERVFGNYGPGQPREVIADLLSGANYNVLIVGDAAEGEPMHVVLSPRVAGNPNNQAVARPAQQDQEEDYQPPEPQEAPQIFEPQRPPVDEHRPITPQERMQMMQERQREMQQQQQQQQQQPQ